MKQRYHHLDTIRGITLISMVLYHAVWDIVYIHDVEWEWFSGNFGYLWQQSICWTFILLSGFCWSLGNNKWKRGLVTLLAGAIVSAVTIIFMPGNRIIFGVLTFLGSAMLIMIWAEKVCRNINPVFGSVISASLFLLFRNVNMGNLGFEGLEMLKLPEDWYANLATAYIGFPPRGFFSTDYFSLLPWFFLFLTGYFLYRVAEERKKLGMLIGKKVPVIGVLGRNSLLIYLVHQPIVYVLFYVYFLIVRK